jgi:hypothetical protein
MQLDSRIQKVGALAKEAMIELKKLQSGEKHLLKTGSEKIDCHIGGLLPGDVVVVAGAPSSGKSETLYRMIDSMLSTDVNSNAQNIVSLEYSMEMKMLNKILRKTHQVLSKKKSDILFSPFDAEEGELVKQYYTGLQDDRRYSVQSPVTPEEFYKMTKTFCEMNSDKDAVVISIDHMLLFSGSDKQAVLEKVSESINLLKLEFGNVYFILLSQLNRGISAAIKEADNCMIPTNALLYGSSFMEQLASYIIIITNPFKQGVNKYLKVYKDRYDYLEEFFDGEDSKGRTSFSTLGNLFYFITKTRESDNPYKDLFIDRMDLSEEQLEKMKRSVVVEDSAPVVGKPIAAPVFDMVSFNTSAITNAQGGFESEEPF